MRPRLVIRLVIRLVMAAAATWMLASAANGASAAEPPAGQRYVISPANTTISFHAGLFGFFAIDGGFTRFSGTLDYGGSNIAQTAISVTMQTDSLFSSEADWQDDLVGPDFFDAGTHPEIVFEATRVIRTENGHGRIEGRLTLRGQTRTIAMAVTYDERTDADGTRRLMRVEAVGTIDRTDYGMTAWWPMLTDTVEIGILFVPENE